MNKKELIKQAELRFPIGTEVRCLYDNKIFDITGYDDKRLNSDDIEDIWMLSGSYGVNVYKNGGWAEIVGIRKQTPNKQSCILFVDWCALHYKPTTNNGVVLFWQKDNYQSQTKITTEELLELWMKSKQTEYQAEYDIAVDKFKEDWVNEQTKK